MEASSSTLADSYATATQNGFTYTDEQIASEYAADPNSYDAVTYRQFLVSDAMFQTDSTDTEDDDAEAEAKAAALLGNIDDRIAQEESRLQAAKLSSAKFFDSARELCQKQLQTLDTIMKATGSEAVKPEAIRIPKEQPAPVSEPTPADSGNTQVFNFVKDEI